MKGLSRPGRFFQFTKGERRGLFAVALIGFCMHTGFVVLRELERDGTAQIRFLESQAVPQTEQVVTPRPDSSVPRNNQKPVRPRQNARQYTRQASKKIGINTATSEDWQSIYGIGSYRAERILKFREHLGGFRSVDQVAETWGLPDSVFQEIRHQLVLDGQLRKMNVNSATAEQLAAHPYVDWKAARQILRYRKQHGHFTGDSSLLQVHGIDSAWIQRMWGYLVF